MNEAITFKRKGKEYEGTVLSLLNNSAIVAISEETAKELELSTDRTVVNHKNIVKGFKFKPGKRV